MAGQNIDVSEQDTTKILQWYSKLFSRRVDLVGDYAGSERFLIHGESLLLQCFGDAQLDFEPGFQLLHASYAVEKFLHDLVSRRCNFHIAFFDDYQDLCVPQDASPATSDKYRLARAAIIRHLQVNLQPIHNNIEIKVFSSISSGAFEEYQKSTDIYFVLCHDGALSKDARKKAGSSQIDGRSFQDHQQQYKTSLRMFIYAMMQQGYSTALINGLEYQDTKVMASVLENSRALSIEVPKTVSSRHNTKSPDHIHNRNYGQLPARPRLKTETDLFIGFGFRCPVKRRPGFGRSAKVPPNH
jgi:hypothetical protein